MWRTPETKEEDTSFLSLSCKIKEGRKQPTWHTQIPFCLDSEQEIIPECKGMAALSESLDYSTKKGKRKKN